MSSRRSHDSQISLSQASHIETKNKEGSVKSKGKCRVKDKQKPNNKKKGQRNLQTGWQTHLVLGRILALCYPGSHRALRPPAANWCPGRGCD